MKVKELIAELEKLTDEEKELEVSTEGCDCDGDVGSVVLYPADPKYGKKDASVYLHRSK